jgi:hypothetical protein
MPLQKILPKPGVNRENTRYTNEGGWYESDKIRFRQGTPEKIGGWQRISAAVFQGVCRSLWNWVTLGSQNLLGVGTNLKFYISNGGNYYDITPIRRTVTLTAYDGSHPTGGPFTATNGLSTVSVYDPDHGCITNDFVTFSGAGITSLGGNITAAILTNEFKVTVVNTNVYTITVSVTASAGDTGHGGSVVAQYQINTGSAAAIPITGWGAGPWGAGTWGNGLSSTNPIRMWSQNNFGEDLIFGPQNDGIYYWNASYGVSGVVASISIASPGVLSSTITLIDGEALSLTTTGALPTGLSVGTVYYVVNSTGTTCNLSTTYGGAAINTSGTQSGVHTISSRALPLSALAGASDTPTVQATLTISDVSRFVLAFGSNDVGSTTQDPMVIRWSDQENAADWTPTALNQAGSVRLSHGSKIVATVQVRQEIVVWTDSSLYSLQYLGPPYVWGSQLLGDNLSIASQNAAVIASGVAFWMGVDKFYMYDGSVKTLRCDLRQYIFEDINPLQYAQVFAGTVESFNEVWWFYCSSGSNAIDRYVTYNYLEDVWCYGTMARTAWLDSGLQQYPLGATYSNNLVQHENGLNDNVTGTDLPIEAYITSAQFDIGDGHNFAFIWRMIPDITFRGSTATSPTATFTLLPLQSSGSGYNDPASIGGSNSASVVRTAEIPVEQFTGQVYTRVRGRQLSIKIHSNQVDTTWQLGAPRIDIRADGRR